MAAGAAFAAVFVFFFIAPLLLVGAVSLWPTREYELVPGFTLQNYATIFAGCRWAPAPPAAA